MPLDKEVSTKATPVFAVPPERVPGVVKSRNEIFVAQRPESPQRNPFLKHYPNPLNTTAVDRGFYPLLYKPTGLLYGR